jgi:hypothetical protein
MAKMDDSVIFLSKIFDLLDSAKVFETKSNELKSIVDFRHPEELKVSDCTSSVKRSVDKIYRSTAEF